MKKTEGFDIWLGWRKRSVGISDLVPKSHTATSLAYCIDSCSAGFAQHVGGYIQSSEMQGLINVDTNWKGVRCHVSPVMTGT